MRMISTLKNLLLTIFNTTNVELLPVANLKSTSQNKTHLQKSNFRLKRMANRSFLLAATLVLISNASWGQSVWSGASSGAWLTAGNWSSGGVPSGTAAEAFFNLNTQPTSGINMNGIPGANSSIGSIHFGASATTARTVNNSSGTAAGTLTLNGTTINTIANTIIRNNSATTHTIANGTQNLNIGLGNATANVIAIDAAGGITISSAITGANPLRKVGTGAGILLLTGANSYTGLTTVNGGTMQLNRTGGTTIPVGNSIVVNSGATMRITTAQQLANVTVDLGGTLIVDASLTITGTATINGTFQINQGGFASGGTWTYGTSSTLVYNNTSGPYGPINAGHTYWPATNGPANVTVQGGGGINMGVARTVPSSGTTGTFLLVTGTNAVQGTALTLNGTTQINGGNFQTTPTYGSSSTLIYNTTYGTSNEWTGGAIASVAAGSGIPANVTVQTGTLTLAGGRGVPGNVTVNASCGMVLNATSGDLYLGGNLTNNGSTWTNNTRAVYFTGTGTSVITAGSGTQFFDYLLIGKSAGSVQIASSTNVTINTTAGDVLQFLNAGSLDLNGRTLTLNNSGGNILANGATGGTVKNITSSSAATIAVTNNKTISGSSSGTLTIGTSITVVVSSGSLNPGAAVTTINGTLQINSGGSISTNSPNYGASSTLVYNTGGPYGTSNEWTGGASTTVAVGFGIPANVIIQNAGTNLTLAGGRGAPGNITVNASTTLTLNASAGDLYLGGNFAMNGSLVNNSRAVFFVLGNAQNITSTNANVTFDWLLIDKTGSTTVTLGIPVIVNNTLTLTAGFFVLGTNNMTVGTTASGSSTSYVRTSNTGQLRQIVAGTAVVFPVGNSVYNPITFTNTGTSDTYGIRVADGNPPNAADPTSTVLRSWYITEAVAGNSNLTPVVGQYNSGDVGTNYNAGVTPYMGFYNASSWTQVATTLAGSNPFTATSTGSAQFPATIPAGSYIVIGKDNAFISPSSIAISNSAPAASNQNAGTNDVVLQRLDLAVTVANTSLTGLNVTTAGSYISADITNLKVRYSTDNILDVGDATLSTLTTPGVSGAKVFPSFTSQALISGATYYIFITADIAPAATGGNTINLGTTAFSNISFSSGTKTGTDPVAAGGVQTFVSTSPSIAISNSAPASSNQNAGTNDVVLQRLDFAVTVAGTTFNGLTVTTTGTYASADIINLKVRYSTDNILDGGDATLSTLTTPGVAGSKVFPSFTAQALAIGTYYIFITADIASTATGGNTIGLGNTAFSNISFTSGTETGTDPVAASNTVTIVNPAIAISNSSPAASSHIPSSTDIVLNRFDFAVTSSNATLTGITVTTAGTYTSADVVNLKVRYSTDATLDGGDATLSTFTTPGVAGSKVFPSFTSQVINAGTTGYIFITADISATATPNNTISLGTTAFSNLTFTLGNKTGTNPVAAGNTRTFIKAEPTNYPTLFACGTTTATSIPLTWTDASTGILPDGYLIQWSNTSYASITAPSDGTPVADLANATLGARNVAQGVGNYTIPSLTSGTTYFMRIWSYTNSGSNINYKLVGEPQTSCATTTAPVTIWTNPIAGTNPGAANPYTTGQTVDPLIAVSGIGMGPGIANATANDRYNANGWNTGALDANDYFSLTLTPNTGYQINFNNLVYTSQASGTGPTNIAIRSSVDGYTANIGTPSITGTTISLTAGTYQNINSAITFRVYAWGGTGGTFSINDFTFTGNVVSLGTITTGTIGGGTTTYCAGVAGVSVPFTYSPAGNFPNGVANFTAQLSDASGLFGSPVNLQSVTSNASGSQSISVTIPSGTLTGTGYRIRVVSTSPTVNGIANVTNLTINNSITSITPAGAQTLVTSTNGATLTVNEGHTFSSRQWKYGTAPGGPYGTNLGTAQTQVPNFASAGTYYIVCESTYPAPCSNTVTSNEVVFTVNNPAPEINITGNSVNIVDGDNTPSLTDHTTFVNTAWGATATRTFTIQNTGSSTLNISGVSPYVLISGSNPSNFSITTPPSNSIAAGSSTTFVVTFTPNAVASFDAILTIPSNDSDEPNYAFYIQGVGTASNLSDVSFNSGSAVSTNANIDYISYQGTVLSNTGTGVNGSAGVMGFFLRDGGATLTDADNLGTELTGITFSVTNPGSIRSARLFNGASPLGAAVTVSGTSPIVFSGLTGVSVADNAQLALSLRVTFNAPVTDNQQMQFTVTSVTSAVSGSSAFAAGNGGGATSSTTGDINRIEVTADRLAFLVQPITTTVSTNMATVTVRGTDLGSSLDLDYTGSIDITSTGSLTGTPVNASAVAGVATYSTLNHSATGTNLTLTATTTGLAFSNTIGSDPFDIVSTPLNSYRTTASGLWNSNTALPAIWERLTAGWTASNSPAYGTSNNVYIRNGHTLTTNGAFGNTVNLIIESGGTLIVDHPSTAASILVRSGGTLQVNASFTIAIGGTFTVEDNADVFLNFAFGNPSTSIWQGNENFGALSNLNIWNWDDAQPLINGNVTANTYSGYSAAFGNVYIDIAGASGIGANWTLLGSSTGTINLTHGNFEFDSPDGFDIRFFTTIGGSATVGIQGDLVLNSGWSSARNVALTTSTATLVMNLKGNLVHNSPGTFTVRASNSISGSATFNIDGNIVMNGAGTAATTRFWLNQNAYGTANGALGIVNLKGNITVGANPILGNLGAIADQQFNFTGTTTQLVNIASVVSGSGSAGVPMAIKANAIVQLNTNNLTLNNNSSLVVEANGTLDFGFNGTTALLVNQPGTPTGTNTFNSAQGSILKITSPDGIVGTVTANLGNVQLPVSNKTFNNTATFWYIGKANQVTGNALTVGSTGKVVISDLDLDTYTLTLSNNIGISNGTLVDALGGKLDIRRGIVVGTNSADFSGTGRLVMSGGTYRIQSNSATVPFLSNYANYSLTGGTVELNATGNQTLSGAPPAYYNIAATGSNTFGTDFKGVSSALIVNNNVLVSGTSVFDLQSNGMTGAAGLTMTGGRLRMAKLNVTLPEITGVATPYAISGGIVELYGSATGQTHSIRGTYNAGASNVSYFNVELNSASASVGALLANVVAQAGFSVQDVFNVNSPTCFQLGSGFTISDAGVTSTFNVNAGATLKYGGTIDASGATGNLRTDIRNLPTTASYGFVGSISPQTVGTGLPATMVNLYMDKDLATNVVTLAGNATVSNQLVLGTGILDAVSNTVFVSNTATTGITGASANSFVSGRLNRSLPASLLTGTTYNFPVGKQSPITYLPANLVNPTTGTGAVSVTMEAFNTNSGGTPDPNSIGSLSTAEYWSLAATGNFNGSQFTLARPTAVSPLSSIGRSTTTATGTYVFIGGTPSGSQIANSNFSAGNTQFLAFANPIAPPTITLVQGTSPTFAPQADYTGYVGQTLTITGTNFTSTAGMTVSIGGLAATTFTVVNSTTITAVVAQAASGATVVVTNTVTSGTTNAAFTFLGWISDASTDWGTGSTWLGGVVPPASVAVTIAHAVTANGVVANNPNTLTIRSGSSLTFGAAGTLTVNTTLTNGGSIIMTAGGILTMANASAFANGSATFTGGTGTVVFAGSCTVSTTGGIPFNNVTINSPINLGLSTSIAGTLRVNQGGSITTNALTYGTASTLSYNGVFTQTANALEFPSVNGPTNFTANNSSLVVLPFSRTVNGNVRVLSGTLRSNGAVTLSMTGASATLEVTGILLGTDAGIGNDMILDITGLVTVTGSNITVCKVYSTNVAAGATLALARNNFEVRYGAFDINSNSTLRMDANGNVAAFDANSRVPVYAATANLVYNSGTAYGRLVEWSTLSGPAGYPGNVIIQNGTTLNIGAPTTNLGIVNNLTLGVTGSAGSLNMQSTNQAITVGGNLTIGSDVATSTLTLSTNATSPGIRVAGNWNRNSFGSLVGTGANGRGVFFNGTGAQSITANGGETFQFLLIQKTVGSNLTLNDPVTVNSTLTLTSGNVILGSNDLRAATQASGSATSYAITNGSGRLRLDVGSSNILFPVGNSTYNPVTLNNSGTADVYGVIARDGAAGSEADASKIVLRNWDINEGTAGGSNLAVTAQWNAPVAQTGQEEINFVRGNAIKWIGNFTSGAWTNNAATLSGSDPYTYTASGITTVGIFEPGIENAFLQIPLITSYTPTTAYTGEVITITGLNLNALTSVTLGGSAAILTTPAATSTTAYYIVGSGASGNLVATNAVGSTPATVPFTYLGYITNNNTDWNTGSTWLGGNVPIANATTTVNHDITINGTVVNAPNTILVNATKSIAFGGGSIGVNTSLTNNGTINMTGGGTLTFSATDVLTNNGTFTGGTGNVVFSGTGTVNGTTACQFNNFTINGLATLTRVPTINGIFQINAGGTISAAPNYGASSTLMYNTGANYGRDLEWSTATGAGAPVNVQISGNTTLIPAKITNAYNSVVLNVGGNLTIDAGSNMYMDFGGNNMLVNLNVTGNLNLNGNLSASQASGRDIYVGGNWTNNGSGVNFFPNNRAVFLNGTSIQTVGGSNASLTSFAFLILNNASGANLSAAINVNNGLTLTNGILSIGNFNLNMASATITGASTTRFIQTNGTGYLRRVVSSVDLTFPVGISTSYAPAILNQAGTSETIGVRVKATPFDQSLADANQMVNLQWYLNESTAGANNLVTKFQWNNGTPNDEASGFLRANGVFHGNWISGSTYGVRPTALSGADPYLSTSTVNYTGNLSDQLFLVGNINGFTSCVQTANNGQWNDPNSWNLGGTIIPSPNSNVCILHNINILTTDPNPDVVNSLTLNAGGSLTVGAGKTITIANLGSVVNASGSNLNFGNGEVYCNGTVAIAGANSVTFNNLTLNGNTTLTTAPIISNALQLNASSFFVSGSPTYLSGASLIYNTGGAYNMSQEWTGNSLTAGSGIPSNVTIQGGTTVNFPTSNRGFGGNLNITNGTLNLNGTSGDLYIGGNWTRNNTAAFNPNNRAVFFNGSGTQTIEITGGGTATFDYLFVDKTAGTLVISNSTATNVSVTGPLGGNIFRLNNATSLDLNGRTLSFTGASAGNIITAGGINTIGGASGGLISISGGTKTVTATGGGTFNFGSNVTLALAGGLNFGTNLSTVNGTLQIALGGFVSTNAPFYGTNSTLRYFSGSAYTRGTEWSATAGAGYPFNVTIDPNGSNTTLNMGSSAANQTIAGNLTINAGAASPGAGLNMQTMTGFLGVAGNVVVNNAGVLTLSTVVGGDIKVAGNFTRNTGGTLTQNNREVEMNGTTLQTINGVNGFAYLAINNTGSTVQISANTTVSNRLRLTNGTLDLNSLSVTMSNGSEIYRTNSTATMNAEASLTSGDVYDVRYAGTLTTGNEFSSNNTFVRDLIIESGALPTMGASRTVNRNVRLAGDLNLGTFTLTHRGRNATLGAAGSIEITSGNRNITGSAGCIYDVIGIGGNNPVEFTKQVTNPGGGTLNVGADVLMRIADGRMDFGSGSPTTINGTLQVALGGSVNPNPCYYGVGSTLRFANTVDYQVPAADITWSTGAIASGLPGIPWNVDINDTGTDLQLQDTRALRNNLTITNGTFTLTPAYTGSFNIGGNWTRTGASSAFNHNSKKVTFDRQSAGNQAITVGSGVSSETFYDLEVSTLTGDVQLGTSSNVNILNNLNFVNGRFNLNGVNNLIIGNSSANGTITGFGAGRYVISNGGNLRRYTNSNATYDFPVGDNATYSPAQLVLTNGGQANAYIDSKVVNAIHPNMTAPVPTRYIARYWSIEPTGLAGIPLYNINYTYSAADEVGTGVMYPVKYSTTNPVPGWFSCPGSSAVAITGTAGADDNVLKTFSWSGLTTFSDFTGAGNGSPLPVELLSFDAVPVNNAEVLVTWTTASEINNDQFIVERSLDAVNFEFVGEVNGAGNSNFTRNYTLTDVKPYNGVSYYRLRQVDFNGEQETFTPVAVFLTGAVGSSMNVFPNPATETATLNINGQYKGKAVLQIIDITGRNISKQQINLTEGSNAIKLDVDGLANGKYLLHVTLSDGTRMNKPLIINK